MTVNEKKHEQGFVLLVLFGVMASASIGLLLAVQAFVPPLADAQLRADRSLHTVELAARDSFRQSGAFPASLDGLQQHASGLASAPWRSDPWNTAEELDLSDVAGALRVRSRGPDGVLGTADDLAALVDPEQMIRVRQRSRLRLIRALLLRSPFRYAGTMESGPDLEQMRVAMHDYAIAHRHFLSSDAGSRAVLTARMVTAAATVATLVAGHGCLDLPASATGTGGLMEQLGLPDWKAIDGAGGPLIISDTVGVDARGADGIGGTSDDM